MRCEPKPRMFRMNERRAEIRLASRVAALLRSQSSPGLPDMVVLVDRRAGPDAWLTSCAQGGVVVVAAIVGILTGFLLAPSSFASYQSNDLAFV